MTHNAPEAISKFLERKARLAVEQPDIVPDPSLDPKLLDLALNHTKRTQLQTKLDVDAVAADKHTVAERPTRKKCDNAVASPAPETVSSLAAWRLLGFGR